MRGGAGVELDRVELAVHEVEAGVDGAAVDRAQDLLLGGGPLAPAGAQGLVEALEKEKRTFKVCKLVGNAVFYYYLFSEPCVLSFLCDKVCRAPLEMS